MSDKHAKGTTTGVHGQRLDYNKGTCLPTAAKCEVTSRVKSSCRILRRFWRAIPYKIPSLSWTEPHFTRRPYHHLISEDLVLRALIGPGNSFQASGGQVCTDSMVKLP